MQPSFPTIYVLSSRMEPVAQHDLEKRIPSLTYDITEAEIVLTTVSTPQRARFEMRTRGLSTEPLAMKLKHDIDTETESPVRKKRRLASEQEAETSIIESSKVRNSKGRVVHAVRPDWFVDCVDRGEFLSLEDYLVYRGLVLELEEVKVGRNQTPEPLGHGHGQGHRAHVDDTSPSSQSQQSPTSPRSKVAGKGTAERPATVVHRPALLQETTSEHDAATRLPDMPEFLTTTYSCQRPTPLYSPNEGFIDVLKEIRKIRTLLGDSVGVRAYSTSIASLAAYPFAIESPAEIERLPGCGPKFGNLFQEWKSTGAVGEVDMAKSDPKLSVMSLFYDTWGVGDATARDFYKKGWRDLDDVVENGWEGLSRVQQIGVKYYEEFLRPIPRLEVENIANTILRHARDMDSRFHLMIVGGYRRGKKESGDVDVVISHPDEQATSRFITKLVVSLEKTGYITHTLTLSLHNSERGQEPTSWKGNVSAGTGFDTLDKALVVWQDPTPGGTEADGAGDTAEDEAGEDDGTQRAGGKRPHRRVDIIISPWKTVGCAVLGWSGGTTFQRDLRRYCKKVKGLKFDSSGIRSRVDGTWVDLEGGPRGPAPDMATAEKRVFEGLGLEWRPPEERCTG